MENCVNINSEEFKNLLKEFNINPKVLAAKVSLWQDSNGLDNFPTKEDLDKYDSTINKDIKTSTHPVLTSNQVIDITSALVFAGLNNIAELSSVEDNIKFETIEKELIKKLRSLRDDTSISNNEKIELVNRYKFILNPEYKLYDFWKIKVKDYIDAQFKLNIKSSNFEEENDLEEDSDGNNKVIEKDSNLESKHVKATANIKYLISTIPDITEFKDGNTVYNKEGFLGLPRFKNPSQMWVTINNILNNVVQIKENGNIQDGYNLMMLELQKNVEYKPELSWLISKVDKMSDSVKSQFFKTFCLHRSNYLDHVIDAKSSSPISKFTDSNVDSKQKHIIDSWASEFVNNFGTYDNSGNIKFNIEKINDLRDLLAEYNTSFKEDFMSKNLSNKTLNSLNKIFKSIGVDLNPNTINKLISKYNTNNTLLNLRTFNVDLFNNLKMFQDIKEGTLLTRANNIIYFNSRFFKELADEESYFSNIVGEDSFIGPDGNRIYIIDNNNTFSLKIKEWKSGDTEYLSDLKNTNYSSESIWVNDMLNPEDDENLINKLTLVSYGKFSKRSDNLDLGDKASDLKPSDTFIDQFNKQLGGYFIGLAEADKTKQYYIKGPSLIEATMMMAGDNVMFANINNEVTDIFTGYLSAELKRMYAAYEGIYGENKIKESEQILYYHTDGKGNPGNAFYSFLLPNLNLEEYGLATFDETNNIMRVLPDKMNKESLLSNQKLQNYIAEAILKNIQSDVDYAIETGLIKQSFQEINGKTTRVLTNNAISFNFLKDQGYTGNGTSIYGDNYSILSLISKYTINSMIGNIEQSMIFNGDPALYKVKYSKEKREIDGEIKEVLKPWNQQEIFGDFMKRIPAVSANGKISRIYKDVQGNPVVREYYNSVVLQNVEVGSSFFGKKNENGEIVFNEENIDLIVKATYNESSNKTIKQYKEELEKLFEPYLKINQTDAQAWITLDTYRERMLSWGEWTPNHEESYKKIKNNQLLSLEDKMLLAQPLKTVHVEYKKHIPGVMNMHYNKQSEAVLLPYFTKGTKLDNLRIAMEKQGIDHAIVLDGKKVGATIITKILDDNGNIKDYSDIKFIPTKLSYRGLFLQQELPPHGLGNRQVGIQGVKNVMAVVEKTAEGKRTIDEYHETISKLSNLGLISLKDEMGYKDNFGFVTDESGSSKLYNTIYKEFYSELSSNHLDAIRKQYPLDAFPIKDKLQNKLNAFVTKKAVKLEQLGGAFIQMSDLGLIGSEISLKDPVGNGIIFFKDPKERLKPMNVTEDGVKPAQILLPYNKIFSDPKFGKMLEKKFGTSNYRELTAEQIKSVFDKKVLEGFSYRIPNQGPSSNDAFEIVGILPPSMGDTMIMFSDITTKTGSDFDIDKAFIILPNYYYDKDYDTIRRIAYDKNHETKEGLENHRLDLMRKMLLNPVAYVDVMSPLDDPWLDIYAKKLYPEVKAKDDLQFFRGTFQANIKSTFDNAKSLVGVIANHMSNQSLFLHEDIGFNDYYLGKGIKTENIENLPEPLFTFENDLEAWEAIDSDKKDAPIPSGTIVKLLNTSREFTSDKISKTGLYEVLYVKDEIMDLIPINGSNSIKGNSLLSNKFDESGNSIANTLGAYMNAIVDAAKDPFIARANINLYTAGTAFMLVRAGIDREWIVSFMGQPIIKDLVYETYKSEGRFSIPVFKNGKKQKAIDKIREKYNKSNANIGNLKDINGDIKITKEELNSQFEEPNNELQMQILNQFLEWQGKSKSMNKLINLTKVDAVGATRNLNRAGLFVNLYNNLKEENTFFGIENLLGYNPESKNMIATYIKNGPVAAREMYKELFIQSTDAVESLVYSILENSGYLELMPGEKNEFLIDTVSNEIYSSMISRTSAFKLDNEELKSILFGNKTIKNKFGSNIFKKHDLAKRIVDLRLGGVTNNLLLNSLDVIVSSGDTPCKVSLRKSENLKTLKDDIVKAWLELDDIDEELSRDLLRYSFYTTGFSGSKGFYEHIPIKLLEKYNFSEEIRNIKRELSSNEYLLDFIIDDIYKNLSYMNEIVPVAPNSIMEPIVDESGNLFDIKDGFIITDSSSDYIAGLDEEGLPVYKRFVKNGNNKLYQLKGYTNNLRGGVYIAVNSLGYKDKGMTVKEYGNESIFEINNVNTNPEFAYLLENTLPLKEIVYEYSEDTSMEINPDELDNSNSSEILKYCTKK